MWTSRFLPWSKPEAFNPVDQALHAQVGADITGEIDNCGFDYFAGCAGRALSHHRGCSSSFSMPQIGKQQDRREQRDQTYPQSQLLQRGHTAVFLNLRIAIGAGSVVGRHCTPLGRASSERVTEVQDSRRKEVQPIQGRCRRFISGFQDSGAPAFKKVHNLFYLLRVYAHLTQCVVKMGQKTVEMPVF